MSFDKFVAAVQGAAGDLGDVCNSGACVVGICDSDDTCSTYLYTCFFLFIYFFFLTVHVIVWLIVYTLYMQ